MPCRYYEPGEAEAIENAELRYDRDRLTRLLCEATKLISDKMQPFMSKKLRAWIIEHQKMDQMRIAAAEEKARKKNDKRLKEMG